ncbi:MAG: hypothetical protein VB080_04230 [Propionicimonas sp.]|uniref:hypothetical protein n=1 Tax=Propionicimonas sp. TaxID=1955623 RepID=UPI002B206EEF|nr:hypothetical protein [Propionicimonas sp.]MEA4943628.1 hypothetical protein [Propionicimonas sp.]MEA5052576.1 hypothetical protein [Propionicimonas sp.]MEA5117614.1 hypothetical protein [Propionicimonas sp.]
MTTLSVAASPMTIILAEIEDGVSSVPGLVARTGLTPDLVRAVVDRLTRTGRVQKWVASSECAPTGCRDCAARGCPLSSAA